MSRDLVVSGAEELEHVLRLLRSVDDKELRKDFYRGINRATTPLKENAKRNALAVLPRRGGLAARVAKTRLSTKARGGQTPGIRVVARNGAGADLGFVRHPVFGNRDVWVSQPVTPGWFTKPMEAGADPVRRALLDVLDDIKRRLAHG